MKIKTELLQGMMSKVIQGASMNKMIPITSLVALETANKRLYLTTTDGNIQFTVNDIIDGDESFYTIVNADIFSKLVGKTTKEYIELINKENYLEVVGNGTYKLEIAINEEGEMVRFPEVDAKGEVISIDKNNLQEAIKVTKASAAKTMEVPCLTGYYIADNTLTTDRQMVCAMSTKIIDQPLLISAEMAELLLLIEGDDVIYLNKKDNNLIFYNDRYMIAGKELEGKDIYPVTPVLNLLNTSYDHEIEVNKSELLNVLDRMALFVTDYDKNGISLAFTKEALCITSQKSNAQELINAKCTDDEEFNCLIDIEMLKSQVETISTDIVKIAYSQKTSIKIIDGNVTHVISLLSKD